MFSVRQKRHISEQIQQLLAETNHPELPQGEIPFRLHVQGATAMSWAIIQNNKAVPSPSVNPHNEKQDPFDITKALDHVEEVMHKPVCETCGGVGSIWGFNATPKSDEVLVPCPDCRKEEDDA